MTTRIKTLLVVLGSAVVVLAVAAFFAGSFTGELTIFAKMLGGGGIGYTPELIIAKLLGGLSGGGGGF